MLTVTKKAVAQPQMCLDAQAQSNCMFTVLGLIFF